MFASTDINSGRSLPETEINDSDLDNVSGGVVPVIVVAAGAAIVKAAPAIAAGLAAAGAGIKLYRALSKWYADE